MSIPQNYPDHDPTLDHLETEAQREARQEHQRRERDRQHQAQQQQASRQRVQQQLNQSSTQMAQAVQLAIGAKERLNIQTRKLKHLEREAGDLATAGPRDAMRYSSIVLAVVVVIGMNFFLINAPVNYLVGSAFADPDAWQAQFATVLIPVALLLLEIYISQQLWLAIRDYPQDAWRWQTAGTSMITFTPLMICGTMLAREDWWASYNLVTSLGLIVLATVTDAAIVFGGAQIHTSQAFVWCQLYRWGIQRRINRHSATYRRVMLRAEQAYTQYVQRLTAYNANHQLPIPPGPFSETTRQGMNEWFGEAVFLPPQRPFNREDGLDEPLASAPRPEANPVNPNGTEAVAEPPETPDAVASERDYYRDLLAGQIRQNERELRAD